MNLKGCGIHKVIAWTSVGFWVEQFHLTGQTRKDTVVCKKNLRNVPTWHDSGWLQLLSLGQLNLVKVRTKGRRWLPRWHRFVLYPFAKLEQDAWRCSSPANRSHVKRYTGTYCDIQRGSCRHRSSPLLLLSYLTYKSTFSSWPFLDLEYFSFSLFWVTREKTPSN